jgi:hypothetical protein
MSKSPDDLLRGGDLIMQAAGFVRADGQAHASAPPPPAPAEQLSLAQRLYPHLIPNTNGPSGREDPRK